MTEFDSANLADRILSHSRIVPMTVALILIAVLCLAFANGANDNFKGVATLFGAGLTKYRGALAWATAATLLGSLTAVLLAGTLLKNFSGRGLVPNELTGSESYVVAVALGAGLTVLLATRIGMPISTTHGLVGALVGAGLASGSTISWTMLGLTFFVPMLLSPVLAVIGTFVLYVALRSARIALGVTEQTCVCIGNKVVEVVPSGEAAAAIQRAERLSVEVNDEVTCQQRYDGKVLGVNVAAALDRLHFLSAAVVSFARGLNDTPKIAALLLVTPLVAGFSAVAAVGIAIAVGGIVAARRVAETMSRKITPMSHGQGFTANLVTGAIVLAASPLGMPVSTTHVSCGALFGIGAANRRGHMAMIGKILLAWVATLPLAALLGAIAFWTVSAIAGS